MRLELIYVKREYLEESWGAVEHYIAETLKYDDGRYGLEHIYEELQRGTMNLWVFYNNKSGHIEGAMITEHCEFPLKKVLSISFLAGDNFANIAPLFKEFSAWCASKGYASIEIMGRIGWDRKLGKMGFEKLFTVMRKTL